MKRKIFQTIVIVLLVTFISCSSGSVLIQQNLTGNEKVLGNVEGEACGFLGFVAAGYHFIPVGLNGRIENAYNDAISKIPGTKALQNISIDETWFWLGIGTFRCLYIKGEALK